MPENHTPTATDALRSWLVHAGFSLARRSAALAALDAFDAALRGEIPAAPAAGEGVETVRRVPCWRGECRTGCAYPDGCTQPVEPETSESEGGGSR